MKGAIVKCLNELVVDNFGKEKWDAVVKNVNGFNEHILPISDIDDGVVIQLIQSVCSTLGISLLQAADAFGDYWINVYAQKYYKIYLDGAKAAREFIGKMDHVHEVMTQSIEHARPPKFKYEWKDDKTLILHYSSLRNLIDIAAGLIKGVGKYYREELTVKKLSESELEITFAK